MILEKIDPGSDSLSHTLRCAAIRRASCSVFPPMTREERPTPYQVCPCPDQGSSCHYYPPLQGQCQQEDNAPTYHGQEESVNLPNRGAVAEFQQEEPTRSSQPIALKLNTARHAILMYPEHIPHALEARKQQERENMLLEHI
uniref:Uncharacterized protein n=1 Tax=Timema cristinae TaxID=61476 RepID=A0A7R9DAQ7_TIMCR|nr:unnamed protein product [Timema cristinae]